MTAKLRHIAMSVPHADVAATANFYVDTFGLRLVRQKPHSAVLTDEVVNLVIISDELSLNRGHRGLHHIGFVVDDLPETRKRIASTGGKEIPDEVTAGVNEQVHGVRPQLGDDDMEHKFMDPNGLTFDLGTTAFAQRMWAVNAE